MRQEERIDILLDAIGIDKQSFLRFLEWVLSEQIIFGLTHITAEIIGEWIEEDLMVLKRERIVYCTICLISSKFQKIG